MKSFAEWVPSVQLEVPNVPRPAMIDAIRRSCIDFCKRTRFWRYQCDDLLTALDGDDVGVREYEFDVPPQTSVASVRSFSYNNVPLTEKTLEWLDANDGKWHTLSGTPSHYALKDTNTFTLSRAPLEASISMRILVALAPSESANACGDILFEQCKATIASGAIWRLKAMAGKPWSDANGAALHMNEFEKGIVTASSTAQNGYGTRQTVRVKPRFI